ncbi:Ferritin-like protein 2 [Klebsiella pneumoniae]|uniref:Ferritin-like protein 2 n=1 Tax=Klebsiella pneumoniae TaxID=573 RepID=A0A377W1W3_KLEPN|nr:Ferritin-like protein 2 [Klebsiella pneumoniae]
MAVPGMAQKLNTQMNLEFHASNVYLNLSEWCARHRFDGAATFLRTRAQSSITLTMRVFDYLKKAGSWPIVNPDHACNPECTSLEDLFTPNPERLPTAQSSAERSRSGSQSAKR